MVLFLFFSGGTRGFGTLYGCGGCHDDLAGNGDTRMGIVGVSKVPRRVTGVKYMVLWK